MAKINRDSIIVAYDVSDDDARAELEEYLTDSLGATRRTESVYEFVYSPPPRYPEVLRQIRDLIDPDDGDRAYVWDINEGSFRRIAVHKLR